MTSLEPPNESPSPPQRDTFDLWMSRLVRVAGLGIALFETIGNSGERPALLGTALVMMTGSLAYDAIRRKALS
jgi:hypothetical protein